MVFCILLPQSIISKVDEEWTFSLGPVTQACGGPGVHLNHRWESWPVSFLFLSEQNALHLELTKVKSSKKLLRLESGKEKLDKYSPSCLYITETSRGLGGDRVLLESRHVGKGDLAMRIQEAQCLGYRLIQGTLIPWAMSTLSLPRSVSVGRTSSSMGGPRETAPLAAFNTISIPKQCSVTTPTCACALI